MAIPKDTLFDPDASDEKNVERLESLREKLLEHVQSFTEEHEFPSGLLPVMLIEMAVTSRMMDYVLSVERPSGSGLRKDLDRLGRDIDALLRLMKKEADGFIANAEEALAAAEAADKSG